MNLFKKQKIKRLLCLLVMSIAISASAQTESEKKEIVGKFRAEGLSYGDYYYYHVKEDKIEIRPKLANMMEQDPTRFDDQFLEKLKQSAKSYTKNCSLELTASGRFILYLGAPSEQTGKFTFIPTYIKPSEGSIEAAVTYNLKHEDDFAILELSTGGYITIYKEDNKLEFFYTNKAKPLGSGDFSASIYFTK